LLPGDVVIEMDGKVVDSAGMVAINGEKMNLNEITERKFAGDKVKIRYIRKGATNEVEVELKSLPWAQMYAIQYEKKPRYIVFAGLVFQPLDTNLFASSKFNDVTLRRLYTDYVSKGLFEKTEDIVVLTRVESDPITSHLGDSTGLAVNKINGQEVKDLKHAKQLLNPSVLPEFHVIELHGNHRPIIISAKDVAGANQRVSDNYGIQKLEQLEP
jgi:hypothetical protein